MTIALWIVAVALIVVGVIGTVLPALPGAILVFAGVALGAWIDDFTRISGWTVLVLGILTLLAWAIDYVAALAGAKKAGASQQALIGAAIGTVAGVFTGFVGLVFLPLVGASVGEYLAQRELLRAGRIGIATWLGLLVGTVLKVAVVFLMVGIFVAAVLIP
jgi:uncharacterized protein YqgC (DUF456 family)